MVDISALPFYFIFIILWIKYLYECFVSNCGWDRAIFLSIFVNLNLIRTNNTYKIKICILSYLKMKKNVFFNPQFVILRDTILRITHTRKQKRLATLGGSACLPPPYIEESGPIQTRTKEAIKLCALYLFIFFVIILLPR